MRKTYQLKTNAIKGEQQVIDVTPAMGKTPVKVPAAAGARYELIDSATKAAPDNIRAMRKGKNLQIFFDGDTEPGAVIENFYQAHTDNLPTLVGRTEQGVLYEYIPESAAPSAVVSQLGDTGNAYGMALGGQELAASGAAVGLLAAPLAAGFSPLLLGAGVLGAAALAGGGGGSSGSGTKTPSNSNAKVLIASISEDTGSSSADFYTADNSLHYSGKITGFTANGDQVKLELKDSYGKIIRTDYLTPDANGNWSWNDQNNTRADGNYTLQASIVDKAGNMVNSGTSQIITIDTSSSLNTDPSDPAKQPASDPNSRFVLDISGMKNDSGVQGDWITNDKNPVFSGSFGSYAFDSTQGQISFQLLDSAGKLISSASPDLARDNKSWSTPTPANNLEDGVYYSRVLITDNAGNTVAADVQKFIIDTKVDIGGDSTASAGNVFSIKANESMTYEYGTKINNIWTVIGSGKYTGESINFKTPDPYENQYFSVKLIDLSGNETTLSNTVKTGSNQQTIIFEANETVKNSIETTKAGTIGVFSLSKTTPYDLGEMVFEQPQTGASLIHNEISMTGNGVQQLALRLNDVLNLGATNSFDTANHVQMRIKGDTQNGAQDKVTLLDSAVWTKTGTSVSLDDNIQYQVFTANNGTVDLFVQSGVQIYKSDGTSFMV